jgi:hypothetical protein
MPVPNTFANATATIPLSQLDANFNTAITIGNSAIQLGNTVTQLSNLTVSNVTVANAVVNSVNVVGYMGIPQNSQNGNYNVVLGDAGKHIYHPIGQAAATYTFPANSNVSFTVGSAVTIINGSANNVTISLTSDTLYLSSNGATGSRTLTQWGVATAVKIENTAWVISGSNIT